MGLVKAESNGEREIDRTTLSAVIELAQTVGGARMAHGASEILGAAEAAAFKRIHDQKLWRGVSAKTLALLADIPPENVNGECASFDSFCKLMGLSRQRVYEKIKLLEHMGPEFVGRVAELGIPRRYLSLAQKIDGDGRRELLKLARDPATDGQVLRRAIKDLAADAGALEVERDALAQDLKDKTKKIERGKKQLSKLEEKHRNAKNELDALKAGKVIPKDDEEALRELAKETGRTLAFFDRMEGIQWGYHPEFAATFAGLVADRALQYADSMVSEYPGAVADRAQRAGFTRLGKLARQSFEALSKGDLAKYPEPGEIIFPPMAEKPGGARKKAAKKRKKAKKGKH